MRWERRLFMSTRSALNIEWRGLRSGDSATPRSEQRSSNSATEAPADDKRNASNHGNARQEQWNVEPKLRAVPRDGRGQGSLNMSNFNVNIKGG